MALRLAVVAAVVIAVTEASALQQAQIPASVPHTLKRESAAAEVTVVSERTDRDVRLKEGGMLEVRLDANHTTGYSWVAGPVTGAILAQQGKAAYKEKGSEGNVGVGGIEVWRFKAINAGKQRLKFEYRRPWEKNVAAAKTVVYSVTVQ